MKAQEEVRKFIQLRAEGLSYEKTARRLGISKWTLMNWGKKYESEIADLKTARLEALREQYCLSVEAKVQMWGRIVNEISLELANKRLYRVTPDTLLDMLIKAQTRLEQAYIDPQNETERVSNRQSKTDLSQAIEIPEKS